MRAEVFDPFDAEPELHDVVLGQELRGQKDLGAEADDRIVLLEEVHGRDADEPGDERVGWLVVDLSGDPDLQYAPFVHDRDPVSQPHRLCLVVSDVDRGHIDLTLEELQLLARRMADLGVEVGQRLVHQEHLGPPDEGARDRHTLPLASRDLRRQAPEQMSDAEHPRSPVDLLASLDLGQTLDSQGKADVAEHRLVGIESVALEDHRDPPLPGRQIVDDPIVDDDASLRGRLETGDEPHERGLAASRGAEKHQELSLGDFQVDPVDGPDRPEVLLDSVCLGLVRAPLHKLLKDQPSKSESFLSL